MAEDHAHSMYITGYNSDGTIAYRKCHFCEHTDEITIPKPK